MNLEDLYPRSIIKPDHISAWAVRKSSHTLCGWALDIGVQLGVLEYQVERAQMLQKGAEEQAEVFLVGRRVAEIELEDVWSMLGAIYVPRYLHDVIKAENLMLQAKITSLQEENIFLSRPWWRKFLDPFGR